MRAVKDKIVAELEAVGGRHDEPSIYGGPAGDPGLVGGPDSVSWRINGDMASVGLAGSAAILMEVLHPSVMAGVFTQSSYRTDPLSRARNTLGYVLRTTFGNTEAATTVIERVKAVHGRIGGVRADGVAYQALDPALIGWVHTCIPWAIMMAYERYNQPLSRADKDRYLTEQAVVGRMGGADWVPETVDELEDYVERMRPLMAFNDQTRQFLDFLLGRTADRVTSRKERFDAMMGVRGSMMMMPDWARAMTGLAQPGWLDRMVFKPNEALKARIVRWALPELPCKALALDRARGEVPHDSPIPEDAVAAE